jgi:hypothetical protein
MIIRRFCRSMTAMSSARVRAPHVENGGVFSDQAFGLVSWTSSETLEPALAQSQRADSWRGELLVSLRVLRNRAVLSLAQGSKYSAWSDNFN